MAGGKMQGLPTEAAHRGAQEERLAALRERASSDKARTRSVDKDGYLVVPEPPAPVVPCVMTPMSCGKSLGSAMLAVQLHRDAQRHEPPKRGRKLDTKVLGRAGEALKQAGAPLTTGTNGCGPAVIEKTLRVPLATARNIARRLEENVPPKDRAAVRARSKSPAKRQRKQGES